MRPVAMPISAAHAKLTAVGELGRGVVQHDGAVDPRQKALGGVAAFHDDAIGVVPSHIESYSWIWISA